MGNLLDRNALLSKEELTIEKVEFENGDFVYVRQMTGRERDAWEQSLVRKVKDEKGNVKSYEQATEDYRAKLAVCTVCDESGKLIMQLGDASILSQQKSAKTLDKIIEKAQQLNKITESDKEDLVKNYEAGQAGNLSSDSAENLE